MNTLAAWLAAGARSTPQRAALLTQQGRWSYAELNETAWRGAAWLRASGLLAGTATPIAAFAGDACELTLAAVACSVAGCGLLPLDPQNADARWPALAAMGGLHLRRLPALPAQFPAAEAEATATTATDAAPLPAVALVIATSGSEGAPKAVMLTPGNLDAAARAANERLPLAAGDLWLGCLPLHHIGGMSILHRCLRAGATLLQHEGFDAATVWRDLHAHPVTHISLVPAMLARLLDHAESAGGGEHVPPPTLRYAMIGGAALSRPLFERARAAGWPLCPSWGMSESAAQAATLAAPGADWREGDVGTPLPGFECRIGDGEGSSGRVHLRGPQVMAGYLNPELRPGDGLLDGWLPTADLGRIDAAGRLTVLGRADDVFVSGGVNVHPLEVESCLAACPGVADVAVTALPDPVWGDALVALVVGSAEAETVREWGRQRLLSAQRPRRVLRVARLPRNAMGKIERAALRALAREAA